MLRVVSHGVTITWWRRKSGMLLGPSRSIPSPGIIDCRAGEIAASNAAKKDDDLSRVVVSDVGEVASRWRRRRVLLLPGSTIEGPRVIDWKTTSTLTDETAEKRDHTAGCVVNKMRRGASDRLGARRKLPTDCSAAGLRRG